MPQHMLKPRDERIKAGMWWDRAWTVTEGCTPVSDGCSHCWAARQSHMWQHNPNPIIAARHAGLTTDTCQFNGKIKLRWDNLNLPRTIRRPTVFSLWNEFFHDDVSLDFVDAALATMRDCPQHLFMALTKRPQNMQEKLYAPRPDAPRVLSPGASLPNVCMGVTVESQEHIHRVATLLQAWPGETFVSSEPALGLVDMMPEDHHSDCKSNTGGECDCEGGCDNAPPGEAWLDRIGLVICGGESGPGARPMHPEWPRQLRDDCAAAGVSFMFKQWGEWIPDDEFARLPQVVRWRNTEGSGSCITEAPWIRAITLWEDGRISFRVGRKFAGNTLEGRQELGWFGGEAC